MENYLNISGVSRFFTKLKETFATKEELSQVSYKIQVITQSEYDALETKDETTLYIIEV